MLLGSEGATAQFGPQKGLPPESVAPLENAMNEMVVQLEKVFPHASAIGQLTKVQVLRVESVLVCRWWVKLNLYKGLSWFPNG